MANFLKRLIVVQVPAHRLRKERRNLMIFASAAAVLGVLHLVQALAQVGPIPVAAAEAAPGAEGVPAGETPGSTGTPVTAPAADQPPAPDPKQQRIARHLAKRYLVSAEAIETVVAAAHRAAARHRLDPLLILAVVAVESRFNPIAESGAGAKGLMQVIPRFHLEKLEEHGGEKAVLDPQANVLVGAAILREYLNRTGDLTAALQLYNGSPQDADLRYSRKVMSERQRLNRLVSQSA